MRLQYFSILESVFYQYDPHPGYITAKCFGFVASIISFDTCPSTASADNTRFGFVKSLILP